MKTIFSLLFTLISIGFLNAQTTDVVSYATKIENHRKEYLKGFLENEKSPVAKSDLMYLQFFKPDVTFAVEATFTKAENEKPFNLATSEGKLKQYIKYGTLEFALKGKKLSLAVYQSLSLMNHPLYKNYLFIPFNDLTNDDTTYGAGRYIDAKLEDIVNGKMELDFNKCYNPYCAYSDGYNCPIPPKENHLDIAIEAGEKKFGKARH